MKTRSSYGIVRRSSAKVVKRSRDEQIAAARGLVKMKTSRGEAVPVRLKRMAAERLSYEKTAPGPVEHLH